MIYTLRIQRQHTSSSAPYWQEFTYEGSGSDSIATVLRTLNERMPLQTKEGLAASPIGWQCSCMVRKCGACAMVINGIPRLACAAFLRDLRQSVITIAPLRKFPVIHDLIVDRTVLQTLMKQLKIWRTTESTPSLWTQELHRQSSRCLLCGCCLEICPNFEGQAAFAGALAPVNAFRILDGTTHDSHIQACTAAYASLYYEQCGHSLSCQTVCPAHIPIDELLAHSNAIAVWHKP